MTTNTLARASPAVSVMRSKWLTSSSHMPGPASIGASRLGAASPAVNRTTVSGDERPAWLWRNPSSASRNRRVRQARSDPVSARVPCPATPSIARRMRAVSEVNGTFTPV